MIVSNAQRVENGLTKSDDDLSRDSIRQDDINAIDPLGLFAPLHITLGFGERLKGRPGDRKSLDMSVPSSKVGSSGLLHGSDSGSVASDSTPDESITETELGASKVCPGHRQPHVGYRIKERIHL